MQYKGFKRIKRVAAVILSAAVLLTELPGVSAAEYVQTLETEVLEETTQDLGTEDTGLEDGVSENEVSPERVETSDETAGEQSEITRRYRRKYGTWNR